jgi:hypothetical protein
MIKIKFIPDFFPIVLLPLYWIFFLSFYIVYLPIYFFVLLFSPWRSKKSLVSFYSKKAGLDHRTVSYSTEKDPESDLGKEEEMEDDL